MRTMLRTLGQASNRPGLEQWVTRTRKGKPRTKLADQIEVEIAMNKAPGWLRLAIALAYYTAFRPSDCLRVAPIHYDAATRTITIAQKKTGELSSVPVAEPLAEMLARTPPAKNATTPYIETLAGGPVRYHKLHQHWTNLRKRTPGVTPDLNMQDLRRTNANAVYNQSKDLRAVQGMLGHQDLSSTLIYLAHNDPEKLRPIIDSIWTPRKERELLTGVATPEREKK
jgi:integrase